MLVMVCSFPGRGLHCWLGPPSVSSTKGASSRLCIRLCQLASARFVTNFVTNPTPGRLVSW